MSLSVKKLSGKASLPGLPMRLGSICMRLKTLLYIKVIEL